MRIGAGMIGALLVLGLIITYIKAILIGAGVLAAIFVLVLVGTAAREEIGRQRTRRRAEAAGLAARAVRENARILAGEADAIYGRFPPATL